jgi:hypothetical protein
LLHRQVHLQENEGPDLSGFRIGNCEQRKQVRSKKQTWNLYQRGFILTLDCKHHQRRKMLINTKTNFNSNKIKHLKLMEFITTWLRFYLGLQTSSKTENANKKQFNSNSNRKKKHLKLIGPIGWL